jgi:hypothetical protein
MSTQNSETTPHPTPAEDGQNPSAGGGSGEGTQPQDAGGKRFTQAEVDHIVGERLREEAARRQREAEEAKQEAERQEAVRRGEQEQVLTGLQSEKSTLEAALAEAEASAAHLRRIVDAQFDAQVSELPEIVRKLAPKRDDLDAFQSWLVEARQLAAHLQPKEAAKGNPKTPPAAGPTRGENKAAIKTSLLRSGRYSG